MNLTAAIRRIGLGAYWALIVAAIHWPNSLTPVVKMPGGDKLVHAAMYGGLAILLAVNLSAPAGHGRRPVGPSLRFVFGLTLALIAAQGLFDELTQPLTGRTCDPWDWLADFVGSAFALSWWANRRWRFERQAEFTAPT